MDRAEEERVYDREVSEMRLTNDLIPFRNSCNVLADFIRDGTSSASILLSSNGLSSEFTVRRLRRPYSIPPALDKPENCDILKETAKEEAI